MLAGPDYGLAVFISSIAIGVLVYAGMAMLLRRVFGYDVTEAFKTYREGTPS